MMIKNNIETPGRFYEYIGAAKPLLLMIPDGALKQIAEEYNASFVSKPKDIKTIIAHISNIYSV
jgi:hypothetical protein